MVLHRFWNLCDLLLDEFALQTQNARHKNKGRPSSTYQQVLVLTGLHVVSRDIQGEVGICRWLFNLQNVKYTGFPVTTEEDN